MAFRILEVLFRRGWRYALVTLLCLAPLAVWCKLSPETWAWTGMATAAAEPAHEDFDSSDPLDEVLHAVFVVAGCLSCTILAMSIVPYLVLADASAVRPAVRSWIQASAGRTLALVLLGPLLIPLLAFLVLVAAILLEPFNESTWARVQILAAWTLAAGTPLHAMGMWCVRGNSAAVELDAWGLPAIFRRGDPRIARGLRVLVSIPSLAAYALLLFAFRALDHWIGLAGTVPPDTRLALFLGMGSVLFTVWAVVSSLTWNEVNGYRVGDPPEALLETFE